jgi:TonB-dependent SusC/RagA subfamily outer membrane receptor
MTSFPLRVLPVSVLVGLIAACAHGQAATATSDQVAPPPSPPPPVGSIAQMLTGRVSGAIVTAVPGGGISVRISGPKSFRLSQEPLYVVDGVPVEATPNGTLSWLNPEDIESIAVLKYDADTAIYGVRGANGVILIKTKGSH